MFGNLFNSNPTFQSKKVKFQTLGSGLFEYIPKSFYAKPIDEPIKVGLGELTKENQPITKKKSVSIYHTTEKMEILFGEDWKNIPIKDVPAIVNLRLRLDPVIKHEDEITKTLSLLATVMNKLTFEQAKFLLRNDHLPKKEIEVNGIKKQEYLDSKELEQYELSEEGKIHEAKLNFYVVKTGIINAFGQLNSKK